jgi:hypothetical protein
MRRRARPPRPRRSRRRLAQPPSPRRSARARKTRCPDADAAASLQLRLIGTSTRAARNDRMIVSTKMLGPH